MGMQTLDLTILFGAGATRWDIKKERTNLLRDSTLDRRCKIDQYLGTSQYLPIRLYEPGIRNKCMARSSRIDATTTTTTT